jgi:hypothetical protein
MELCKECCAECHLCWMPFKLTVTNKPFVVSVVMLNVIRLSVVMLNVVATLRFHFVHLWMFHICIVDNSVTRVSLVHHYRIPWRFPEWSMMFSCWKFVNLFRIICILTSIQGTLTKREIQLTSLHQTTLISSFFYWNCYLPFFYKTSYPIQEANCTERSPPVRLPWSITLFPSPNKLQSFQLSVTLLIERADIMLQSTNVTITVSEKWHLTICHSAKWRSVF